MSSADGTWWHEKDERAAGSGCTSQSSLLSTCSGPGSRGGAWQQCGKWSNRICHRPAGLCDSLCPTTALWVLTYPFTEVTNRVLALRQWKKERKAAPQKYGKLCELVKLGTEIKLLKPEVWCKSCPASLSCKLHWYDLTGLPGEAGSAPWEWQGQRASKS